MRSLSGCRRGTAALEFALASGPTLLLLLGFVSTSAIFYTWTTMLNSAQNAAMLLATGQITSYQSANVTCGGTLTTTQAEYYACQNLPSWASFTVNATKSCTAPASVTVTVSAGATRAAIADVYNFFSGKTLTAKSYMIKQGTCP